MILYVTCNDKLYEQPFSVNVLSLDDIKLGSADVLYNLDENLVRVSYKGDIKLDDAGLLVKVQYELNDIGEKRRKITDVIVPESDLKR